MVELDAGGLFVCGECGLKYAEREIAQKCEKWCATNHSCNLEIIKKAVIT